MLRKNLEVVNDKIKLEKDRNPALGDPKIIAVSKKQSVDKIRDLYELGIRNFGENYLQEALDKISTLKDLSIDWHFIGSLQTKKIKDIVGNFSYIHSVSRLKEVEKISQIANEKAVSQKIFIQVNIGNEKSKSGILPSEALNFCLGLESFASIEVVGLMVFPPIGESEEEDSQWFQESFQLFSEIQKKMKPSFNRLSMGTSLNYEIAYREGATDLRIGESLLGQRIS